MFPASPPRGRPRPARRCGKSDPVPPFGPSPSNPRSNREPRSALGTNGHTASLFPQLHAVRERTRWVMAEDIEMVQMWRITLTPVILNYAAEILFIVSGREKAAILRRVLYGAREPGELPAQAIAP